MDAVSLPLGSILVQAAASGGIAGSEPAMAGSAVQVIASLAVVLGLLLAGLGWSRRFLGRERTGNQGNLLRILGGVSIGLKKNICLVEIPGSVLVVGVSQDSISLLATIDNKETQDIIKGQQKGNEREPSAWSRLSLFSLPSVGAETEKDPKQLLSYMKGKLLTLGAVRRIRPRLYPVLVGKHEQE